MNYRALLKAIAAANTHMVGRAAAVVNQALVLRNWLIGAYLVEYEQGGADRAKYGLRLLERLADDLSGRGVKGVDPRTLRDCRLLFQVYPQIRGPVAPELERQPQRRIRGPVAPELKNPDSIAPGVPLNADLVLELVQGEHDDQGGPAARGHHSVQRQRWHRGRVCYGWNGQRLVRLAVLGGPADYRGVANSGGSGSGTLRRSAAKGNTEEMISNSAERTSLTWHH